MPDVRVGMRVRGSNHQRLGRVVAVDGDSFVVRKGSHLPHQFRVLSKEVIRFLGDTVVVSQHRPEIAEEGRQHHRGRAIT